MSTKHALPALWTAVAAYSILSFFFGSSGLYAMRSLAAERDRLATNMESLERINRNLGGSMDALRYDADTIAVHARELGYGARDERFIRLVGLPVGSRNPIVAGNVVKPTAAEGVADTTLRIFALILGVGVFIILSLRGAGRRRING